MEHKETIDLPAQTKVINPQLTMLSLLQEANHAGLISQAEMQNIQVRIMEVLKDVIIHYTSGASSSVKVETAQNLMLSILYCIDFYYMSLDDQNDSIKILKSTSIKEIYKKGLDLIQLYVQETEMLYTRIKAERLNTRLIAYNSSIDEAIGDFFLNYDVRFGAHETAAGIGIDYPLMFDDMSITGILYIRKYLEILSLENTFCRLFDPEDIEYLMENYGRTYHIPYEDYLLNICEIVLTNAAFTVMLGKQARKMNISPTEYSLLKDKLNRLGSDDLPFKISQAMNIMIAELSIVEPSMLNYIRQYEPELLARLKQALQQDTLNKLVILTSETNATAKTIFEQGHCMDNDAFRVLFQRVLDCKDTLIKVDIILSSLTSLTDFVDLLNAECLFGAEYLTLFGQLGDMEISILARIVFSDELRMASFSNAILSLTESEKAWENQFIRFLQGVESDRLHIIEDLVNEPLASV